ncbi:MAG: hypothetical protein HY671_01610 [Chloroflexi bacterium]|nr:hypothetical protein [Chloroflexota bacterium]
MKFYGYAGRILRVDLTTGRVQQDPLDLSLAEAFIGGWGMNARLAFDLIRPKTDALSPEMPLIFGAGVLNGTLAPSAPKSFLTTKCPASGAISTAVGSGYFGPMLKWAGYDHVIVTGRAPQPVYLTIFDNEVKLHDAGNLWGKDIVEATDELHSQYGQQSSAVCIGPAGERLVRTGMVLIDKCATLGRSNAANFGSKNLKAIVVKGTKGLAVCHSTRFKTSVEALRDDSLRDPLRDKWAQLGLYLVFDTWAKAGYFIHRNQTQVFPEKQAIEQYGAQRFLEMRRCTVGCPGCLVPDKFQLEIKSGEFAGLSMTTSTADTMALAFGTKNEVGSLDRAVKLLDMANRYGIDCLTFSAILDFCVDLYEKGIINREDTGGLALDRGFETTYRLLEMTARAEGFGQVLGAGWLGAIQKLGKGVEKYAYHIKGTEPDFDARISFGVEALGAVTNPRGAHDMPVGGLTVAKGRNPDFFKKVMARRGLSDKDIERIFVSPGFDLGRLLAHYENWATVLNCLGICFRMQSSRLYDLPICADVYSAATGIPRQPEDLSKAAERAYNIYRALNAREGFDRKDDRFPQRWLQPLKRPDKGDETVLKDYFGIAPVTAGDVDAMLDRYYEEKGWDPKTGIPTRKNLAELGLEYVADALKV